MNDYMNGEILYCGKCHTPKEKIITLFGVTKKVNALCRCGMKEYEQRHFKAEEDERRYQAELCRERWIGSGELKNWTFANDNGKTPELTKIALNYSRSFIGYLRCGKGLLIYGPPGPGKTRAAACIANSVVEQGFRVLVTNFSKIASDLQGDFDERSAYVRRLNDYDLLVIDDLATERGTDYVNEIVQTVIDGRYLARRPMIVTTNLDGETFKHPKTIEQQRVISRLCERCIPIKAEGVDLRRERLNEQYQLDLRQLKGGTDAEKGSKETRGEST